MDEQQPPAKPRLEFGRGRGAGRTDPARKAAAPATEDVLAKMAGKLAERRRAASRGPADASEHGDSA